MLYFVELADIDLFVDCLLYDLLLFLLSFAEFFALLLIVDAVHRRY